MASINTRSSVLAVVVEDTEGVLKEPTASSEYLAIQDDLAMEGAFDDLENAELKNSLGKAKSIRGLENPTSSFSHYLRHSGVEGQAPAYGEILKAAFGNEVIKSPERDTVAASSTSVIKVDAGEGAEFERGMSLLIKDSVNGYSIRPVDSVSTDDLNIGFNVGTAPGTGVNLGQNVTYTPADKDHQSLSVHHFIGNGGARQSMAGARVTALTASFAAGELINSNYSMEGIQYFFNPITVKATDVSIDWTDDQGTATATVEAKSYKDPHELAAALQTAMNGATTETITVSYSDTTGQYTIAATGAVLSLLWNTGANTANTIGDILGFDVASDDTGSLTYTGDSAVDFSSPQSPVFDDADPLAAKSNELLIGDAEDNVCIDASTVEFSMNTPKKDILSICAESGKSGSIINERTVEITVTALLEQYDADKFRRFRENTDTKFLYNFGTKTGGNWNAGKCGSIYVPTATITAFNIEDDEGLASLTMTLSSFVNEAGDGEVYMSFV